MIDSKFAPWPDFTEEEIKAVTQVLHSNKVNYWTGNQVKAFEQEFAKFADTKYAIAVANGTLALDLAMIALGLGHHGSNSGAHQDEVIVTSRTFIATVSTIVNAGAKPVFADVDANSQNISVDTIRAVLTDNTRAIVCVHLAGMPCEMEGIMALAEAHGLKVIEDCAQAHGAKYRGKSVGSIGHIGAWSFCQDKIMTTGGEGGMVTTNDEALWQKMWAYKDHGKSYDAVFYRQHPPGFRWLHESFGSNFRMTEMQAAIGRIQLQRMPQWLQQRQQHANQLSNICRQFASLRVIECPEYIIHAYYKFYVFIQPQYLKQGWTRDRIIDEINRQKVPCFQGSCSEVYLERAFDDTGFRPPQRLPIAQQLGETSLMFLVHPTITEEQMQYACRVIRELFLSITATG